MKRIILLALLLACSAAQATEWVRVGESAVSNEPTLLDVSSIRIANGVRRAWVKTVIKPHTQRDPVEADRWVSYTLARVAINCADETYRYEAGSWYFEDGGNANAAFDEKWHPITPESVVQAEMEFICALKPR